MENVLIAQKKLTIVTNAKLEIGVRFANQVTLVLILMVPVNQCLIPVQLKFLNMIYKMGTEVKMENHTLSTDVHHATLDMCGVMTIGIVSLAQQQFLIVKDAHSQVHVLIVNRIISCPTTDQNVFQIMKTVLLTHLIMSLWASSTCIIENCLKWMNMVVSINVNTVNISLTNLMKLSWNLY